MQIRNLAFEFSSMSMMGATFEGVKCNEKLSQIILLTSNERGQLMRAACDQKSLVEMMAIPHIYVVALWQFFISYGSKSSRPFVKFFFCHMVKIHHKKHCLKVFFFFWYT